MSKKVKLLNKAQTNPGGLTFDEICRLAAYGGYSFDRQRGSHQTYTNQNIQNKFDQHITINPGKNGTAWRYQVEDLVELIFKYGLI